MLQVSDFEAAGRGHGPLRPRQYDTSTLVRLLQFARASSVPAGRNSQNIGRGVRGFKLVMVSAVSASSWRFRGRGARARTSEFPAGLEVERHESGAVGEWFKRPWEEQWAKGPEVSVNLNWWPRRSSATARFWAAGVWKPTDFGFAQVQSRQVDQGTQAGKICTEKDASVGAGVRYSNICIDRLSAVSASSWQFSYHAPAICIGSL